MTVNEVIDTLQELGSEHHRGQYARFGIEAQLAFGVKSPDIQRLAKSLGKNHLLAVELFEQPVHEAKLMAAFMADPTELTRETMDHWASQVYSWDLCDNLCMHLFRKTSCAETAAFDWIKDDREFVRRCGLVIMTSLSIHNKSASDNSILKFSEAAIPYVMDERNFVKKAISWLLRTQGKRNLELRKTILTICDAISVDYPNSKSAKWIVGDVRRELMKNQIIDRLKSKAKK